MQFVAFDFPLLCCQFATKMRYVHHVPEISLPSGMFRKRAQVYGAFEEGNPRRFLLMIALALFLWETVCLYTSRVDMSSSEVMNGPLEVKLGHFGRGRKPTTDINKSLYPINLCLSSGTVLTSVLVANTTTAKHTSCLSRQEECMV